MLADGYYDGDLAGWTLWCTADVAPTNRLFDVAGQLLPDYLVSIREPFRNLRSGVPEKRTLTVYNKRFRDRRMRLVRETVGLRDPTPPQTWTFTVPAGGRHVMEVEVCGDCSDKPLAMRHRYTLSDADTGERLFEREWKYTAFPNAPFAWPDDVAVISNGVKDAAAAIASGCPIVVARTLSRSEGRALKSHVASGGKVMIVDAKVGGWLPIPLRYAGHSFLVSQRKFGDVEAPAAIVLEPGEKTRIEIWTQYPKAFHFLGALAQDAADGTEVLKVSYGYRDKSRYDVKVFAGDQVNGFSREGKVKSGRIGWKGYSNKQPAAVLYCWKIPVENPRYLASFIELENTGPVPIAIVAITAERCPPSS